MADWLVQENPILERYTADFLETVCSAVCAVSAAVLAVTPFPVLQGVDGEMLEDLDQDTLRDELNVTSKLHRTKILKSVERLLSGAAPPAKRRRKAAAAAMDEEEDDDAEEETKVCPRPKAKPKKPKKPTAKKQPPKLSTGLSFMQGQTSLHASTNPHRCVADVSGGLLDWDALNLGAHGQLGELNPFIHQCPADRVYVDEVPTCRLCCAASEFCPVCA